MIFLDFLGTHHKPDLFAPGYPLIHQTSPDVCLLPTASLNARSLRASPLRAAMEELQLVVEWKEKGNERLKAEEKGSMGGMGLRDRDVGVWNPMIFVWRFF